ncbi:unnamed protein product [Dicrocoelium dendriticum]|nr:unnamed protein product [Dicrocoelium dendriticum]
MVARRRNWSEEEASRLFAQVTQFLKRCANKVEVCRQLFAQFPGQNVEGIKKQLMKMRWPRRRPCSELLLWDSPVVLRVPPIELHEVGAESTGSNLVSDKTTTNQDPYQNEEALEPNLMQFSYEEQYRSFLEGLWRESDPHGVFGELVGLIPPDGEEGASPKVALEMIKSPMGAEVASPKAGLKVANWSVEILTHSITELKHFSYWDDLAGQLAEKLQNGTLHKSAGVVRLCEITEQFFHLNGIPRRNGEPVLLVAGGRSGRPTMQQSRNSG